MNVAAELDIFLKRNREVGRSHRLGGRADSDRPPTRHRLLVRCYVAALGGARTAMDDLLRKRLRVVRD